MFWLFDTWGRRRSAETRELLANTRLIITNQGTNMQAIQDIADALTTLRGDVGTLTASLEAEKAKVDQLIALAERGAANGLTQADLDQLASIKGAALDLSASVQKANADVQGETAAADAALNPPAPSAPSPSPAPDQPAAS